MSGGEAAAIVLLFVVHVAALGVLIYAMLDDESGGWRGWWPRDDDPDMPEIVPPGDGGVPLPDAVPAGVRFRGPGLLADNHVLPRRPEHAPEPARRREPA